MPDRAAHRVVIVGAGHAGATLAATLREHGFAGELVLLEREPVRPYHRPPLSKSLAYGDVEHPLYPDELFAEQAIELRIGASVTAIDRHAQAVVLDGGRRLAYGTLVLATGASPRPLSLPGTDRAGVHVLRTLADAERLMAAIEDGGPMAIVGGGWIGLEVAASARTAGVEVTVIEREQRPLRRVASAELSAYLGDYHRARGVRLLTSTEVTGLRSEGGGIAVALSDGEAVRCASVLLAVGATPNDGLAAAAGLVCEDGVVVDADGRTGDPAIFAIGDVTRRPLDGADGRWRLESIPSATEQARRVTASIVGASPPAPEVPWFWSDQFDLMLQIAGVVRDADATLVRAGEEGRRAIVHLRDGRLIALEAINAPGDFEAAKRLIGEGAPIDLARAADMTAPLGG